MFISDSTKTMRVAIHSSDDSHTHGYYSKIDGLLKAAKGFGLDYVRHGGDEDKGKYDVVINWEPFGVVKKGTMLTIVWVWDTYRQSMREQVGGSGSAQSDVLFRAHATFYHKEGIDPRQYPTYWMPPAVDEEVFKRDPEIVPTHDVVFVGQQRYMPEFKILKNNFNMLTVFDGLNYKDYIKTMCKGRLVLNVPVAHETNKRVLEAMAIGPALMSWGPDYTLLATPDKDFVCYSSIRKGEEKEDFAKRLVEKVKYYLGNPKLLYNVWLNGRTTVEERFTFKHQVQRIEEIIKIHT